MKTNGTYIKVMKKIVIFDFNGVIINSISVQKKAFYQSYRIVVGKGRPPSFANFLKHSGNSIVEILTRLNLPAEMADEYKRINRELIDEIKMYSGVKELLGQLKKKDFELVLYTGKDRVRVLELLRKFSIELFFDLLITSDDVKNGKPNAEAYEFLKQAYRDFDIKCVMVGDGVNDILFAKRNHLLSVAVTWGEIDKKILVKENPDFVAESPQEIASFLGRAF